MRIAINGFGRIGRNFLRILLQDPNALKKIDIVAINIGPACIDSLAHMFKYDTLMGTFDQPVTLEGNELVIGDYRINIIAECDPTKCPWKKMQIDWIVDCSGRFTKREGAMLHLEGGAKYVLISAPAKGDDVTIIPGVNDANFDPKKHHIVSLGSCTTNALVPMVKVLHDTFVIQQGFMTTVHAYTNSQVLLDVEDHDLRRARAAALNIIPTSTGASRVLNVVMPELTGKIKSMALRVPVGKGSLIDLTFTSEKVMTAHAINDVFLQASQTYLKGIMDITNEPIVSSDCNGTVYSVIIDGLLTDAQGQMGKVLGWYDNEWAYSYRLKDFLLARLE